MPLRHCYGGSRIQKLQHLSPSQFEDGFTERIQKEFGCQGRRCVLRSPFLLRLPSHGSSDVFLHMTPMSFGLASSFHSDVRDADATHGLDRFAEERVTAA